MAAVGGSHWGDAGLIAFGDGDRLWAVSENGGVPQPLTEPVAAAVAATTD